MRFDCSDGGGDVCERAAPVVAMVAIAAETRICLNMIPFPVFSVRAWHSRETIAEAGSAGLA